jgi:RNA-directed DNA polymerase
VTSTKPYDISKRMVLEAYRHVRANRGAAGIDGESIEMFEADLSRNLYKLWNRMASGSYFPPLNILARRILQILWAMATSWIWWAG